QEPPLIPMPGNTPQPPQTIDGEAINLGTTDTSEVTDPAMTRFPVMPTAYNVVTNTEFHDLSGWDLNVNSDPSWSISLQSYPLGAYTSNKVMRASGSSGEAYIGHDLNYSTTSNTPLEYLVDLRVVSGNPTIRMVMWPKDHTQTLICAFTPGVRSYMQTYGCRGRTNAWSNIQVQVQVVGGGTVWVDNPVLRAYPTYPAVGSLPTPGQSGWSLSPVSGTSWTFGSGHYRAFAGWRNSHLVEPSYVPNGNGSNGLQWKIRGNDPALEVPLAGVRVGNFTHVEVDMAMTTSGACWLELYFQTDTFDYYTEETEYNSEIALSITPSDGIYYLPIPQFLRDNNALITSLRFDPCGRNNPSASDGVRIDRIGFVTRSNIELLRNLSFEDDVNPADGVADFWGIRNGSGERRLCQADVRRTGMCAFEFQGNGAAEDSILQQRADLSVTSFSVGDVLTLRGYARSTGDPNFRVRIIVNYSDGTLQRVQARYDTASAVYTAYFDDFSLIHTP
nr:hypothetical protein [Anaerolineae bacterium]